jgi:hypothetical protein
MITLPKMISAMGNDCLVAAVTMVCMYWRATKKNLAWNLPLDFEKQEWNEFYQSGLKYVRISGMPHNNIKRFLSKLNLPLSAKLELLEGMFGLRNLINLNVPPIVIYDHMHFLKGIRGPGHAAVIVDQTEENLVSVDPSLEPKYYCPLFKTHFEISWKLNQNATIIIYPKTYTIEETRVPTKSLMNFIPGKEGMA